MNDDYEVLGEYLINWGKEDFSENLTRFHGEHLPPNSRKEKHCGNGEFLLVVFLDKNPAYGCVDTSRGSEYVNSNVFSLKEKYRRMTGGGHKVHTTNSPEEAAHDLALLLGVGCEEYLQKKRTHVSVVRESIRSFAGGGEKGWDNLEQLFSGARFIRYGRVYQGGRKCRDRKA